MKQILTYIKKYFKAHFNLGFYLTVAFFLAISIYLNYHFNFERGYINSFNRQWFKWFLMSATTGFPFLFICGLMYVFGLNKTWAKSREFWLMFMLGFIIIGFQRSFFFHYYIVDELPRTDKIFVRKILWYIKSYFTTLIPLLLFYAWYEKNKDPDRAWYGLKIKNTDFKPYLMLIGLVVIGIGIASFMSDLTNYYPRFLKSGGTRFSDAHELDHWIAVTVYELVYGVNFLNVEFFFRGFLVIGFMRVLGGHAVMAMVGSYVFLHFGKPMTECISSAFGGYIIGVMAFYSKRIWGGVVLHVALAWSMEFFAWLQKLFSH